MASFSRQAYQLLSRPANFAVRRTAHTSTNSTRGSTILPWVLGSVTAVCAASGVAAFYNSKISSTVGETCGILEVVKASAAPPKPSNMERSFIMIKPDGVQRGLVADIIKRFEQRGFHLVAMKLMKADVPLLEEHYGDLKTKPFFPTLLKHISSGPVVPMVWEGKDVVKTGRVILGETDPLKSQPGTIRGDYCIDIGRNIIHGSDSVESADKEIALWFKDSELVDWSSVSRSQVYEK